MLEFGLHSAYHPNISYTHSVNVQTNTMDNILKKYNIPFNFINLDIQGVELNVLKGMKEYLNKIYYIYTEVNNDYVYKNCNLIGELDDFLKEYNFQRVETVWTEFKWGDALYKKII